MGDRAFGVEGVALREGAERVSGAAAGGTDGAGGERLRVLAAAGVLGKPAACVHCGGVALRPWGATRAGVPRLRCAGCRRTFTALTGTLLARIRRPDRLLIVLADMLSAAPSSCRALAARLGLDRMTVWTWRGRIARALAATVTATAITSARGAAAAAALSLRESRKASREWVRHERDPARYPRPDRLRWYDYPRLRLAPPNDPRFRVPVRLVADREGGLRAEAGRLRRPPDAGGAAPDRLAEAMRERFAHFIQRFRGPATRHLAGYLAWFGAWAAGPNVPPPLLTAA
jgi:transposase-like protein